MPNILGLKIHLGKSKWIFVSNNTSQNDKQVESYCKSPYFRCDSWEEKSPRRNPIKFNTQYKVDFVVCFVFPNWHYISLWSCTTENHTWLLVQQDWSSSRRRSKYRKMISKAGIVLRKVPWEAGEGGRKELNTTCVYISRSLLTYIPHYFWFWVKNNCIACCPLMTPLSRKPTSCSRFCLS